VASRVVVENAPDRLVIRENRWGGRNVADLGEYATADHDLAALFAAAPDMYWTLANAAHLLGLFLAGDETVLDRDLDTLHQGMNAILTKIEGR
jgi:hypothetical protein